MIKIFSFKITVISPERRINENSGGLRDDIYTSYQVESVNKDNIHRVWRRYNQFLLLVRIKESIICKMVILSHDSQKSEDPWITGRNFDRMVVETYFWIFCDHSVKSSDPWIVRGSWLHCVFVLCTVQYTKFKCISRC